LLTSCVLVRAGIRRADLDGVDNAIECIVAMADAVLLQSPSCTEGDW